MTPTTHHLTAAQLRELGAQAADDGIEIYEATIRAGLKEASLLEFEAGYFKRRFDLEKAGAVLQVLWDGIGRANPIFINRP